MKVLLFFLFCSFRVFSQETGSIVGTLVDDSAKCIPNACVSLLEVRNGYASDGLISTRTNKQGEFSFDNVPVGSYFVSIDLMNKLYVGINYSDEMQFEVTVSASESLNLENVVYTPNSICMCEIQIVPYVEPKDPFGRFTTLKGDDLLMNVNFG